VASGKRDRAGSSRLGVTHHGQRPIFGSMLGLGRTAARTGGAESGCRLSPARRVHRHPEPLSPSEDAIGGLASASGASRYRPKCSPGSFGARWSGILNSEDDTLWSRLRSGFPFSIPPCLSNFHAADSATFLPSFRCIDPVHAGAGRGYRRCHRRSGMV
jgi:hypothetical protein